MNKRGSHVGMILSFAIFILFLVFVLVVLNPSLQTGDINEDLFDYLKFEIEKNLTGNLQTLIVKFDQDQNSPDCLILEDIKDSVYSDKVLITKEDIKIDGFFMGRDLIFNTREDGIYKVYLSDEFKSPIPKQLNDCNENSEIINIKDEEIIFLSKIEYLAEFYNNNYSLLKDYFKLPPNSEFEFSFIKKDGNIINEFKKETDLNIISEELVVRYIDTEGIINTGFLKIRLW